MLCYETNIPLLFFAVCKIIQRTLTVVGTVPRSAVVFYLQKKGSCKLILKLSSGFKRPYIFVPCRQRRNQKSVPRFGLLLSLGVVDMFFINLSYVAMLQEVAHWCCLPYVSYIHEVV